jgi:hypothetical protein
MPQGYFKDWKKVKNVSFGVIYIFFNLWVIFNVPNFVPADQVSFWYRVFISYGILNSILFANADMRNALFNTRLVDFLPRFLVSCGLFLVFFYFVLAVTGGLFTVSLFQILGSVPLWLALIHALTFATTESVIWQGYLDYEIGHPWSEMVAGLFHLFIWTGAPIIVFISATILFAFFSLVNLYYGSKNDLAAVIGCHFSFNIVKLGLIVSSVVVPAVGGVL